MKNSILSFFVPSGRVPENFAGMRLQPALELGFRRTRRVRLENGGIVVDSGDESDREKPDHVQLRDVSRAIVGRSRFIRRSTESPR